MQLITASGLLMIFQAVLMLLPGGNVKQDQTIPGKRLFFRELLAKVALFVPTKGSRSLIHWSSFSLNWRKNGILHSMKALVLLSLLADQRKKSGGNVAVIASTSGRPKFLDVLMAVAVPIALIREPVKKIAWQLNFPISLLNCTQLRMVPSVVIL